MAILGGASTIRNTGVAQSRNASKRARSGGGGTSGRGTRPTGYQGYGRPYSSTGGAGARGGPRFNISRPSGNISKQAGPRRSALPIPSADAIAALFNQIAGLNRNYHQYQANYGLQRSQLSNARGLYLQQLADAFNQSKTASLEDYASRGLADSGIAAEGLAKLENEYQGQVGSYNSQYNDQLAQLLQTLQGNQSDIVARRQALESQYHRMQAQRAAALKLAGYGG